jgi:hypothetical protein
VQPPFRSEIDEFCAEERSDQGREINDDEAGILFERGASRESGSPQFQ